jgi:hypothetical protein
MERVKLEKLDMVILRTSRGSTIRYIAASEERFRPGQELDPEENEHLLMVERNYKPIWIRDGYTPREL